MISIRMKYSSSSSSSFLYTRNIKTAVQIMRMSSVKGAFTIKISFEVGTMADLNALAAIRTTPV